ncbi:hypothetical protein LCGC14_1795450 [marine sediment metagenome]|uniref:Glycosyl transferase family 1 domain-containing protein n=1 Tax=marine sediment metagenome TaxID=412755 RepID=A0A0F9HDX0_9ZZZZ
MKRKLFFIINSLKRGGGAQKITSDLILRLSKTYEIYILTFQHFEDHYPIIGKYYPLQEYSESLTKSRDFLKFFKVFRRIIKIYKLIQQESPDLIISVMDLTNIYTIFTKFLFRLNIPLIISVHTNPTFTYSQNMRYINLLIKFAYSSKHVNKVVTVSKEIQKILENDYNIKKNKLQTIYNGIEMEKIKKMKNLRINSYEDLFLDKEIIKFINVSRLVEVKGHKYLIEAFSNVKKEISSSKLFLIGDGPLKNQLNKLVTKKSLIDDVLFLGFKKNPYKFINKSDVFVLSSKHEALPTVLLEALACGTPIISTNCEAGPKEILNYGKYGILVKVMDSEDLANKMIYLAKDKDLLHNYSKLSIERSKFFDIKRMAKKWNNLIEFLANDKKNT